MDLSGHQERCCGEGVALGGRGYRGCVLYDDSCGFCRRWVPFWEKTLRRRGFCIAPIQSGWVGQTVGLSKEALLGDIRLLLAGGGQAVGAGVYRHVMRRIWWAYPLYLFSVLPGLGVLFDWGYRVFANHRHRFSRACGLPGADGVDQDKEGAG